MKRKTLAIATVVALGLGSAGAAWLIAPGTQPEAEAADHNDPPGRVAGDSGDKAADIADLYVFTRGENTVFVMTFAGPAMPTEGQAGNYDADVLFRIAYDDNGGFGSSATGLNVMNVRFAQNTSGNWGVQIENFPTSLTERETVSGPVERTNMVSGGAMYWAGLRDDPFFFDLTGFLATASSGDLSFSTTTPRNDDFAGQNVTAVVIQVPNTSIGPEFDAWASSMRITGS